MVHSEAETPVAAGVSCGRHAIYLAVHDREVAHQLFDDVGDDGRVIGTTEQLEYVRMLQQRNGSQRDHARRGLVAQFACVDMVGDEPADEDHGQVVVGAHRSQPGLDGLRAKARINQR
jgi:hypothetical protein